MAVDVVTRLEQDPDRQDGSEERVDEENDHPSGPHAVGARSGFGHGHISSGRADLCVGRREAHDVR